MVTMDMAHKEEAQITQDVVNAASAPAVVTRTEAACKQAIRTLTGIKEDIPFARDVH
jgi:hypothetical protein